MAITLRNTCVWTAGANTTVFATAGNWQGGVAPAAPSGDLYDDIVVSTANLVNAKYPAGPLSALTVRNVTTYIGAVNNPAGMIWSNLNIAGTHTVTMLNDRAGTSSRPGTDVTLLSGAVGDYTLRVPSAPGDQLSTATNVNAGAVMTLRTVVFGTPMGFVNPNGGTLAGTVVIAPDCNPMVASSSITLTGDAAVLEYRSTQAAGLTPWPTLPLNTTGKGTLQAYVPVVLQPSSSGNMFAAGTVIEAYDEVAICGTDGDTYCEALTINAHAPVALVGGTVTALTVNMFGYPVFEDRVGGVKTYTGGSPNVGQIRRRC